MCTIELGINNCFAVKRWPEPEAWIELVADELGLKTVQYSLDLTDVLVSKDIKEKICKEIRQNSQRFGVNIHSCFTGIGAYGSNLLLNPDEDLRAYGLKWYENAIEFASILGCESAGGYMGAMSVRDYNDSERYDFLTECLLSEIKYLSQVAKDKGLKSMLWEPMPVDRELLSKIDITKRFIDKVNQVTEIPVFLCLDLGHMCSYSNSEYDKNPYNWIKALSLYSPVIHIQQNDGNFDSHLPFIDRYNRTGIIEREKVIQAIEESGAEKVILMLEVIHSAEYRESTVIKELKESIDYWRESIS